MKKTFSLLLAATAFLGINLQAELNNLSQAEDKAGWKLLFDGKGLEHFRGYKKDKPGVAWKVDDNAIKLSGKGGGDGCKKSSFF